MTDKASQLETIYPALWPRLVAWFRQAGLPADTARELTQDTFVEALRSIDSFRGDGQLSTWVYGIAKNTLLEHRRTVAARPPAAAALAEAAEADTLPAPLPAHLDVQGDCLRRGFAAFERDHPDRAHTLRLACVEGWSRERLARHLGRTVRAATEYVSQCREKLRPYINDCDGD